MQIKEASEELGYQVDDTFCLKISQLREIFVVRWSVFLLGPAGCGKTAIWKTLLRAQQMFGEKSSFKPINPKARCALRAAWCAAASAVCERGVADMQQAARRLLFKSGTCSLQTGGCCKLHAILRRLAHRGHLCRL